jgi:hypothetical protein
MYFEVSTDWADSSNYGRITTGWHDTHSSGLYNRVVCDPYGTTIKSVNWSNAYGTGSYAYDWNFGTDGAVYFPTNYYEGPPTFQRFGMGNLFVVNDGGWVLGELNTGTNTYGGDGMRINPGIEGPTDITLPSDSTANVAPLAISNWAGGGVRIVATNGGSSSYTWDFTGNGVTSIPGTITTATVTKTTSSGNTIEIDLTKAINKLTPTQTSSTSNGVYHLADGVEGQIMHLVAGGTTTNTEYTGINIDNARWGNGNDINVGSRNYWLVFYGQTNRTTMVTISFTDGHWNLPHGQVD